MQLLKAKTARFLDIAKQCGAPDVYLPLQDPEKDKQFLSYVRAQRVLTVHQEAVGSRSDFGTVGYTKDRKGIILVFPQSLRNFEGKRIVGIKYDELASLPSVKSPSLRKASAGKKEKKERPARKAKAVARATQATLLPAPLPAPPATRPSKSVEKPSLAETNTGSAAIAPERRVEDLEAAIARAIEALSNDRPVAAYKILQKVSA